MITTFAAIDVGSYNVTMEIFEMSKTKGLHSINRVRQRLELGKDAYNDKKISRERIEELCHILTDFKLIMQEYQVSGFKACAKSALRESRNGSMVIAQVFQRTGILIHVLSNSEQRFLGYKSIASKEDDFHKMIEEGTAIVDVGGGSIQISLFDKDVLVATQNILLGSLRIRERLSCMENNTPNYEQLVEELIQQEIYNFKRLYLKDRNITNFILMGDYFTNLIFQNRSSKSKTTTKEDFMEWYKHMIRRSPRDLALEMGVPMEHASVIIPSAVLYRRLIEELGAEVIWLPGIALTDGIAYDYGEKNKFIKTRHNFEDDIIMAAKNMGRRYGSSKPHIQAMERIADSIFDSVKRTYGMSPREKLLLKVAVLLHDCGKYISLANVSQCSYNIIMSTEIIGLSHKEREIIAQVVKYNTEPFEYYSEVLHNTDLSEAEYMLVANLTAILRLANVLDRSHMQKIERLRITRKDNQLILNIEAKKDFTLEQGLFLAKADFFEEVYNIKPVIKLRKLI